MQTFKVEGMTCGHCRRAVTSAVHNVDPKAEVHIDLVAGIVRTDSSAAGDRIAKAIGAEGYPASQMSAPA